MPNIFATLALLAWPIIGFLIYRRFRYDLTFAAITIVVISFSFLPSSIALNFPGLPPVDKVAFCAITLLLLLGPWNKRKIVLPTENKAFLAVILIFVFWPIVTVLFNGEPIRFELRSIRGMQIYDVLGLISQRLFLVIVMIAGYNYINTKENIEKYLVFLVGFGLFYSLLVLFEVRMSPQLHINLYGYFPHSWQQTNRDGGYRPVVFFIHGLWLAFFIMTVMVSAAIMWRQRRAEPDKKGYPAIVFLLATCYLAAVLALCRSLGSLVFGMALLPMVLLLGTRLQTFVAAGLVLVALTYPLTRGAGLFPTTSIVSAAQSVSEARAASLAFRFEHEDALIERAMIKPITGWGGWSRNRVHDAEGNDVTVLDGYWISMFGSYGLVGLIGAFGLMAVPVLTLALQSLGGRAPPSPAVAGLALLIAINLIELLPNSTLPPWTLFAAGGLMAYCVRATAKDQAEAADEPSMAASGRSRRTVL